MRKYKAFYRVPKYYSWLVKLYIPAIFIVNTIIAVQLGLFWGSYEALKKDSLSISSQVYTSSVGSVFKDQKAKAEFIGGVRAVVSEVHRNNENTKIKVTDLVRAYDTKYGMVNQPKNRMASWLINQYGDRINTMVVYGLLNSIPDVQVTGDLSYREFDKITKQLLVLDPDDIEKSIIEKLQNLLLMVLKSQFKTMAGSLLMVWVILMLVPWLEFWIYTYVTKKITKRNNPVK